MRVSFFDPRLLPQAKGGRCCGLIGIPQGEPVKFPPQIPAFLQNLKISVSKLSACFIWVIPQ